MGPIATALICTAIAGACGGPAAAPVAHAEARPASHFAIAFERSGGPKHNFETLVVSPGLHAYATAPKGDLEGSKHFKMDAWTAEELRRDLAAVHFTHLRSRRLPTDCPDCYVYSITYHGHTLLFPESKSPRSLDEVIDLIEGEVIEHLYRPVYY